MGAGISVREVHHLLGEARAQMRSAPIVAHEEEGAQKPSAQRFPFKDEKNTNGRAKAA